MLICGQLDNHGGGKVKEPFYMCNYILIMQLSSQSSFTFDWNVLGLILGICRCESALRAPGLASINADAVQVCTRVEMIRGMICFDGQHSVSTRQVILRQYFDTATGERRLDLSSFIFSFLAFLRIYRLMLKMINY